MAPPAKLKEIKARPQKRPAKARLPESGLSLRLQFAIAALALSALVFIIYGNSLSNGFVWDDHEQIVLNPTVRPGAPLVPLLTSDQRFTHREPSVANSDYRPLQMLTYRMVVAAAGFSPNAFHLCSVLFAAGGTLAAFAVFWLLTRKVVFAFAAAALFAVNPLHTEAVDWIAALPDLGCGLFFLLAFACFLAGRRASHRPEAGASAAASSSTASRWHLTALGLVAFAASLLWKETAAVFPLLVIAYVFVVGKNSGSRLRAAMRASAPYWSVLVVYLALRVLVLGSLKIGSRNWELTPAQSILTLLHLMLLYWWKLALPIRLNAYYVFFPVRSITDLRAAAAAVFALCGIAALVSLARRAPLIRFAALWVCLTLLPAMDIGALGRNVFTERYLYLPSAGFGLLVTVFGAWLLNHTPEKLRRPAGWALLAVILSAFAWETIDRNKVWASDTTLFAETLRLSPDAPFVRYMVATSESADPSRWSAAEENYQQAIELAKNANPPDRIDLTLSYQGLAWLYANRADYGQALDTLTADLQVAPGDTTALGEKGMILARAGRWSEAEPLLEKLIAEQPDDENVLSALGQVAWQYHHDLNRAAELFSRTLAIHTQQDDFAASLHNNLGSVYAEREDFSPAIDQFRLAVGITPGDPEYHTNLASALGAASRYDEARSEAEAALRIDPGFAAARAVLQQLETAGK